MVQINTCTTISVYMVSRTSAFSFSNKSGVKRLKTLGHLDQYIEHGRIVKQSYCETV